MGLLDEAALVGLGLIFGLSLAAPPGPVNATMALEAARRSRWYGSLVGSGALTTDATYFVLVYNLGRFLPEDRLFRVPLFILGAAVLLALAWGAWRRYRQEPAPTGATGGGPAGTPYLIGLALGFTNPLQILWWLTVGLGIVVGVGLAFVAGFFLGIGLWVLLFPWGIDVARTRRPRLYPFIVLGSLVAMVAFAGWFLVRAMAELM